MEHDRFCPKNPASTSLLNVCCCDVIAEARSQERAVFSMTWQRNLRPIEIRNQNQGIDKAIAAVRETHIFAALNLSWTEEIIEAMEGVKHVEPEQKAPRVRESADRGPVSG